MKETDYRISVLHNIKVSFLSLYWLCVTNAGNHLVVKNVVTVAM